MNKIKVLGSGETTAEQALKVMGDAGLGIITAWHYDYKGTFAAQRRVRQGLQRDAQAQPDFFAVGGYDGMHAIYEALKKSGGKTDSEALVAAAKGLKWESPRGPMSIDPEPATSCRPSTSGGWRGSAATLVNVSSTRSRTSRIRHGWRLKK